MGGKRGADIHALQAWKITRCSPQMVIAVVDTGVDARHPELKDKLVPGATFIPGTDAARDDNGHGTAIAAIAAAATNNGKGIAGVCPLGRIMPVKVAASDGYSYGTDVARGIRWAVDHGARVINVSLGSETDAGEQRAAAMYAYSHDVVVVAGTGNDGQDAPYYPAGDPHVLAVGGSDNRDRRWKESNYGVRDLVLAPAVRVVTVHEVGKARRYDEGTGTSFATPHVAGLAALIRSVRPDLTVDQVIAAIERGADHVRGQKGFDRKDGWGRINCYRSLNIARSMAAATPVATPSPTATAVPTTTGAPRGVRWGR